MKYAVLIGAFSLVSTAVMAQNTTPLSYDYVDAGYQKMKIDDADDLSLTGYGINVSKQFAQNWYVQGHYSKVSDDFTELDIYDNVTVYDMNNNPVGTGQTEYLYRTELDITRYELALGYIYSLSDVTKIDYSAKLGQLKFEGDVLYKQDITYQEQVLDTNSERYSDSDTADILSVNAQIRHLLTDSIELNAGIGYERLHDEESENNTVLHVGANYAITADWLVTAAYRDVNDYSDLTFSIRYNF